MALQAGAAVAVQLSSSVPHRTSSALGYSASSVSPAALTPPVIGSFNYYGCIGLSPTFKKVATNYQMSLDFCAASCPSNVFGVYGQECYCADKVEAGPVADSMCSTICPGNKLQKCGGVGLLTVYKRPTKKIILPTRTITKGISPGQTITVTLTRTKVGIVTACPPHIIHCPVGSKTTSIWTEPTPYCPIPAWYKYKITCYGDYCAPEHHCHDCQHQRVVCEGDYCHLEHDNSENSHKLVICKGGHCRYPKCEGAECARKITCFNGHCAHEICYGEECKTNLVCRNGICKHERCYGPNCHQKIICHGKECKVQPHCESGVGCPVPPPPGTPILPVSGISGPGNGNGHGKLCPGPNGTLILCVGAGKGEGKGKLCPGPNGTLILCVEAGKGEGKGEGKGKLCPGANGVLGPCPEVPVVQVGGSDRTKVAFNLLGAAAGLAFML
ncbi:hypothetical protein HIM_01967 [Hirsutella minnesotensis 3608]|nr:hypothetical protein HIM_01967 [Hirsutella minnesotensis 3608]